MCENRVGGLGFVSDKTCKWDFPECFCGEVEQIGSRGNASKDLWWCIVKSWSHVNGFQHYVPVCVKLNAFYHDNFLWCKEISFCNTCNRPKLQQKMFSHQRSAVLYITNPSAIRAHLWTKSIIVHEERTPILPIENRALPFYSRKPLILHDMCQIGLIARYLNN